MVSDFSLNVKLLRVQDNQIVDAILTTVSDKHLADALSLWAPQLIGTRYSDADWNWEKKNRLAKILPGDELYAIECEGITQGLMTIDILKKRCQIESQYRRRLVYISALATGLGTVQQSTILPPTKVLVKTWLILLLPVVMN